MAELITDEFLKLCPNKSHLRFAFEFYKASKIIIFSSWGENNNRVVDSNHTNKVTYKEIIP